jgi:hypothetical protein
MLTALLRCLCDHRDGQPSAIFYEVWAGLGMDPIEKDCVFA